MLIFIFRIYCCITCYYRVTWLYLAWLSLLTVNHENASFRDPTAQTTDGGIYSAEPSILSSNGFTTHRVATAWAQIPNAHSHTVKNLKDLSLA